MTTQFHQEIIAKVLNAIKTFPNRNAFCIEGNYYSYSEFGSFISRIRVKFRNHISSKDNGFGLVVNNDIETYASIFALWLEGKFYVPLHPNQPIDRCMDIVDQVSISLILDSSEQTRYTDMEVLTTSQCPCQQDCLDYEDIYSDDALAYILFTSGSTGTPKGVTMSRLNVASFMNSFWQTGIEIDENDRCLQCFDLTFDVSVQSYLVPLTNGACAYTVNSGEIKYIAVSELLEEHRLTFGAMAPSMLRYLKPYFDEIDASSLRVCILTAEACPLALMEDWFSCAVNTDIYDFYGPTEATIYCTYYKVERSGVNKSLNGIISIGHPLANVEAIIIDENYKRILAGEKGELCIAGPQVTLGYWKNEEKNREAFFNKEVNGVVKRFYHTGDLCYQDTEGDIMYSGRLDYQAKIQGFRVELGEIEFHARKFLETLNAVAIAFDNQSGLTEIALFIESTEFNNVDLMKYLRSKMPSYMIPSVVIFEPIFPLNANDKIDRKKLKEKLV